MRSRECRPEPSGRRGALHRRQAWTPPVDIEQHAGQMHIRTDLPGVSKQDVQIEILRDQLIIEGERRAGAGGQQTARHRAECNYGHFYRVITLPAGVDPDSAQASMHDGVLDVSFRMAAAPGTVRRLDIQGG
ncbi:Hsp20/alpha crystallin family protein [Noviherbaspirillum sedimenti]|nr:Hsp20/alpha crystallin family protein [Noviherbaspirillum sedimenti]